MGNEATINHLCRFENLKIKDDCESKSDDLNTPETASTGLLWGSSGLLSKFIPSFSALVSSTQASKENNKVDPDSSKRTGSKFFKSGKYPLLDLLYLVAYLTFK